MSSSNGSKPFDPTDLEAGTHGVQLGLPPITLDGEKVKAKTFYHYDLATRTLKVSVLVCMESSELGTDVERHVNGLLLTLGRAVHLHFGPTAHLEFLGRTSKFNPKGDDFGHHGKVPAILWTPKP